MWSTEQSERYNLLREREHTGPLTEEEQAELEALIRVRCEGETASLAASNERRAQEIAAAAVAVKRLEEQNRQLREYLGERQAFLARVKSLIADIQAEDRQIRLARISGGTG